MRSLRISVIGSVLSVLLCWIFGVQIANGQTKPAETANSQTKPAETANSQTKRAETKRRRPISAADQRAIIALFKDVDPSKYRLQFNHGKVTAGTKKVEMGQLEQVNTITNPEETKGWVVLIVVDDGAVYILAASHGAQELVDVLGKEKTAKLNRIMAKYHNAAFVQER